MVRMRCAMMRTACFVQSGRGCGRNSGFIFRVQADSGFLRQDGKTFRFFKKMMLEKKKENGILKNMNRLKDGEIR